jgi:nucleolar MIF4G domain-containing protein 1
MEETEDGNTNDSTVNIKTVIETADPETIKLIQRSLNNSLNRLSENTLESVSKSVAALYSQYPFHDMNTCLWKNIKSACIPPAMVMSGLIPLYIAAVSGVHFIGGDRIQLGGCLIEWAVKELYDSLEKGRRRDVNEDEGGYEFINKEASNTLLIVCYLYNYGVVHCTLIYDLVKDLIKNFSEIDVESLLLILSHCGQQLRSDDPSALREIILMVKDRAQIESDSSDGSTKNKADSSRVEFMVATVTELKNNKPRKQDLAIREKTGSFKKCIGRLKSSSNSSLLVKGTGSCLRITLQDVLDAETKGRWWIMGASWAGNQKFIGDENTELEEANSDAQQKQRNPEPNKDSEEGKLMALACNQRMNTDIRRSIFCIVMTSSDYNDAFVKLSRAELLKPKNERDVIRVLVHCCGEEKSFNPYYAHLIMRVCEYQPKSKFTLMLSFWDIFKQLETFNDRKTANLAKLLAKMLLGTKEKYLTLGALKRIDFSPTNMTEQVVLFLSIVLSTLFESASDRITMKEIFGSDKQPSKTSKRKRARDVFDSDDEDDFKERSSSSEKEDLSELKESIATFLLQYCKSSPKNIEGSRWNENFTAAVEFCETT